MTFLSPPSDLKITPTTTETLKFIILQMGNLNLALPINMVYKVVNVATIHSSGLNPYGITRIDDLDVTVIDVYQRLFQVSEPQPISQQHRLIIARRRTTEELVGIPISHTPNLLDIPLQQIRLLPESYRRSDTLGIASHIAVLSNEIPSLTIFIIDVELLFPH